MIRILLFHHAPYGKTLVIIIRSYNAGAIKVSMDFQIMDIASISRAGPPITLCP
jgi:hypothetical protein